MSLRVGLDLDDVTREFVDSMRVQYNRWYSDDVQMHHITEWDLSKSFKWLDTDEKLATFFQFYSQHPNFKLIPETPGALHTINELRGQDVEFCWITASHVNNAVLTYEWMVSHGLPIDNVYFGRYKGWLARKLSLDAFVDDGVHNLDDVKKHSPFTHTILYDRPWNRKAVSMYSHERVRDWNDLYNSLKMVQAWKV